MFVIEVAPLTKIPIQQPQVFSYFSAHRIDVGALILIQLGKRQEKAIVIETHGLGSHKMEIKSAGYQMRPIKKVLSAAPILTENQIKLGLWLSQCYFASPGLFLKMMLPKKVTRSVIPSVNEGSPAHAGYKKQKLILVPTIVQIDAATKNYSKEKAVVIHSGLRAKQLSENWQKVASGETEIVIGTRLAAFSPFLNLKEITIKDETNSGHRSWDMFPHYRVHEIAMKLAELFNADIRIESKLPSVESQYISPIRPIRPISPIAAAIIDLRAELREGNFSIFSRALQNAINEALINKQQIILFLNRRGTGTFVLCRDCGYVAKCQNCDAPLTYHLTKTRDGSRPLLICHHCSGRSEPPSLCPKCQSHKIKAFGSGTQRVEAEAEKLFPNAKILRLDSDTAQKAPEQENIIEQFKQKKADILIGTQMMLSHDLPKAALVAIISADTLMHLPDFRSDERLFQTIEQLKNLAKFLPSLVEEGSGEVMPTLITPPQSSPHQRGGGKPTTSFFIQTYNPQNKTLQMAAEGNYKDFYQQEIETRQILKFPPFSQLIKLVFRHHDPKKAGTEAKVLAAKLTQQLKTSKILKETILEVGQAIPAFISKQKGRYVWQIVIKAKPYWLTNKNDRSELLKNRNKFLMTVPAVAGWEIDVDPETLL